MTEIFNSYYAEKSFRGMCTVQKYHWHFSLLTISFIFVLGFAFGSDSCVSKIGICLLCEIRFSLKSLSYEQPLFSFYYRPVVPGCAGCAMAHPDFGRSVNPISTRGDRLCPPNYYWHTQIFRPSDGPAVLIKVNQRTAFFGFEMDFSGFSISVWDRKRVLKIWVWKPYFAIEK